MRAVSKWAFGALVIGFAVGCEAEPVEEYPETEEVPIVVPDEATPAGDAIGTDTVLDPVVPPPPGTTPP